MTTDADTTKLSIATLLWTEFEHRHTHCWTMIFQLTAAVLFLSGVPYLDQSTTLLLGGWIMLAPVLSIILAGSGMLLMYRELFAFAKVKSAFYELQSDITSITRKGKRKNSFRRYLLSYTWCLLFCAILSAWISFCVWLPALQKKGDFPIPCWPGGLALVILGGLSFGMWELSRRDSVKNIA